MEHYRNSTINELNLVSDTVEFFLIRSLYLIKDKFSSEALFCIETGAVNFSFGSEPDQFFSYHFPVVSLATSSTKPEEEFHYVCHVPLVISVSGLNPGDRCTVHVYVISSSPARMPSSSVILLTWEENSHFMLVHIEIAVNKATAVNYRLVSYRIDIISWE